MAKGYPFKQKSKASHEVMYRKSRAHAKRLYKSVTESRLKLAEKYPNDREAYTDSKTEWIKKLIT